MYIQLEVETAKGEKLTVESENIVPQICALKAIFALRKHNEKGAKVLSITSDNMQIMIEFSKHLPSKNIKSYLFIGSDRHNITEGDLVPL